MRYRIPFIDDTLDDTILGPFIDELEMIEYQRLQSTSPILKEVLRPVTFFGDILLAYLWIPTTIAYSVSCALIQLARYTHDRMVYGASNVSQSPEGISLEHKILAM